MKLTEKQKHLIRISARAFKANGVNEDYLVDFIDDLISQDKDTVMAAFIIGTVFGWAGAIITYLFIF